MSPKMKIFAVLISVSLATALTAAESPYVLDVQYANESNDTFHVIGPVTKDSTSTYLDKFPWIEQLKLANSTKTSSPTVSVKNATADRFLAASIVGEPEDFAYLVLFGKKSKMHEPRILLVKKTEDMKVYFARFLSGDIAGLDKYFAEKGQPPNEFFK